jgi:hypothetical protein
MHTEKEASSIWCPMTRSAGFLTKSKIGPAVNRIHQGENGAQIDCDGSPQPYAVCIASKCAMWRCAEPIRCRVIQPEEWPDTYAHEPARPENVPKSWAWEPGDGDPPGWVEPEHEAQARRRGFCGLAGNPASNR